MTKTIKEITDKFENVILKTIGFFPISFQKVGEIKEISKEDETELILELKKEWKEKQYRIAAAHTDGCAHRGLLYTAENVSILGSITGIYPDYGSGTGSPLSALTACHHSPASLPGTAERKAYIQLALCGLYNSAADGCGTAVAACVFPDIRLFDVAVQSDCLYQP